MRVEKSTTDEVNDVLRVLGEKKREREGDGSGVHGGGVVSSEGVDFEEEVRRKDNEVLRRKAERARRREERKRRGGEEGGGSTHLSDLAEEKNAEEMGATGGDQPVADEGDADEDGGIHPDIAAMMGFSGFGGSRK